MKRISISMESTALYHWVTEMAIDDYLSATECRLWLAYFLAISAICGFWIQVILFGIAMKTFGVI